MGDRAGALVSIAACLVLLAVLLWPYTVRSLYDVNTYYQRGFLNPLLAGVLVVGVLVAFAAARARLVSRALAAGVVLGLGLVTVVVSSVWAATARVDVFRAPGWALPAQRFVLVGISLLLLLGAAWHTWANDLLSLRR